MGNARARRPPPRDRLSFGGATLTLDPSGAVYWPAKKLLVVADLHLEKGSSFARRGSFLPPYDTRATLDDLAKVVERYTPRLVVCLGDSFHDLEGTDRLHHEDAKRLSALTLPRRWIWVTGNHDPGPLSNVDGRCVGRLQIGGLTFVHQADLSGSDGEISGHLHPKVTLQAFGRRLTRRCLLCNSERLILPAFGAFTGGLDVADAAFRQVLGDTFDIYVLGRDRVRRLTR